MKKIKLLCTVAGVSTLATSACALTTSCSTTSGVEVKSITAEITSVKAVGSTLEEDDITVKAQLSDGTEEVLSYGNDDGYELTDTTIGYTFNSGDVGLKEIGISYKNLTTTATVEVVNKVINVFLVGSQNITLSQTQGICGAEFAATLSTTDAKSAIYINEIKVGNKSLTSDQYKFVNNKLTIGAAYTTSDIVINASLLEQTYSKPLGITANVAGTFSVVLNGNAELPNLSYSTDNGSTWTVYKKDDQISLAANATILLKGDNPYGISKNYGKKELMEPSWPWDNTNCVSLKFDNEFTLSGDLAALIDNGEKVMTSAPAWGFYGLFANNRGLKSINGTFLKRFTTLSSYCFTAMFYGCAGLTDVSNLDLPAAIADTGCYQEMFAYCNNLTDAPTLASKDVRENCYKAMFRNCTSLEVMPELPATTLNGGGCYQQMFDGCTSLTTLKTLPAVNAPAACYIWMFRGCTNLYVEEDDASYGDLFFTCPDSIEPEYGQFTTPAWEMFEGCAEYSGSPSKGHKYYFNAE